jgi:putative PEP-CTERM system histidine kinase
MMISFIAILLLSVSAVRILQLERGASRVILAAPFCAIALLETSDLLSLGGFSPAISWRKWSLVVEALLPSLWLLLSLTHARDNDCRELSLWGRCALLLSALLVLPPALFPAQAFYYAPDFPAERMLFLTDVGYYFYVAILVLMVVALTNFEATLVNASPDALWRVKLEVVALGSMLAVLIFYYSNALLQRTLNMDLVPLRALLFIVAVLMLAYSRLHWRGKARVKVSQRVLFRSVVLAVTSCYLIFIGALGEGMKYFGAQFPRYLTLSVAFVAGIALLLVLLSERLKRQFKVFLHKNFYQSKYDYRAQWLGFTKRLETFESGDDLLKRVLCAYCDIFGVRGGALFLYQEGCGWFCATAIRELQDLETTIADDNPLLAYLREKRWVFHSKDDNPGIIERNADLIEGRRISFIIPLFEGDQLTGFIALGEQMVQDEQFLYEDYDLMKTIASQASIAIQHHRLSEQLTQAKAMEAMGNLATFVAHDLKNLAAAIALIVENARDHIDNPEFQKDMLTSLGSTSQRMQGLIAKLRNLGETELLQMRPVDLLSLVQRASGIVRGGAITVKGSHEMAKVDEEEIQKVLLNLFVNAVEASTSGAPIIAEVGFSGAPFIRVSDHGCGMSPRFVRSELFAPFRTTKVKGLGIGMYQCRQIIAAHGGRVEVSSIEGDGTVFTVWLPAVSMDVGGEITKAA